MSRDKKRPRTPRRVEESDDDYSVLGTALTSERTSARSSRKSSRTNSARSSRKSSRTNSATASRSSSRIRGLSVVDYGEQSDDEDVYDDDYGNDEEMDEEELMRVALWRSLEDYQGSRVEGLAMEGSVDWQQQQQQQQQQEHHANTLSALLQDISFEDEDVDDDDDDVVDDDDDDYDVDDDEEEEEEEYDDEEEYNDEDDDDDDDDDYDVDDDEEEEEEEGGERRKSPALLILSPRNKSQNRKGQSRRMIPPEQSHSPLVRIDEEYDKEECDEDEEEADEEEDEDDKFNVDEVEDVERHNLRDVVHKDSNYSYAPYARIWWENGFVDKGALDEVGVVSPQKPPEGANARNAVLSVGGYPCCKNKVYAANRTTNALLNGMSRLGVSAFIYWIDSVLFSGNKTNAAFVFNRIGPILKKYPELRREFFLRFQHGVCALHRNRDFSQENEYVVCVLCGKDIAEQAFDRWVEDGFITVKNSSPEDLLYSDNNHTVFLASFSFEGTNFEVLVVRGAYHPTAHLHAHGFRKLKKAHEGTCSVVAAAKAYARKTTATTKKKTINEHLQSLDETYVKTVKERKEKWRVLLQTDEYWLEVFAGKNSTWFQDAYAMCRNMQLENHEVFKNVQTVFETFGTELALKFLRTSGFAFRLGQVDTAKVFVEKLLRVFEKYCGKNPKLFAQLACGGLFAHLFDADFFKKMDVIFEKYCGKDPKLFAQLACGGLFAHYRDADFFEKMDVIFEKYCNKNPKLFAQIACGGLFAHLFDADFFKKMDVIFEKYCGKNPKLFAKLACGGLFAHYRDADFFKKMDDIFEKYCGKDPKLFAKLAFNDSFLSAMSKHPERYRKTLDEAKKWTVFQGDKTLFEKAMVNNSFASALTNGAFCAIMEGIHESPAFVGNDRALKNLFYKNTIVSALAKYGKPFLTALEEEKESLFPNDNIEFACALTRVKPGQRARKITLQELADKVTKKMNEKQSPP